MERIENGHDRRAFITRAISSVPFFATASMGSPAGQEVPNYTAEVPPSATLWGVVVFTSDEPVEVTVAAPKSVKALRGRFNAQRLAEYSWRNAGGTTERVIIRATALAGARELKPTKVQFLAEQNVYVGFGRRGTPANLADRRGAYPYEAVFVGFIIFEES